MLNLDCRCDILLDHIFGSCVSKSVEFLAQEKRRVTHAIDEIRANISNLESLLAAAAADGAEIAPPVGADGEPVDFAQLVETLKEVISTREHQLNAISEAQGKLQGVTMKELDLCDDSGSSLGVRDYGPSSAADVLEHQQTYNLCRRVKEEEVEQSGGAAAAGKKKKGGKAGAGAGGSEEKIVMLTFAIPPDEARNLDSILGHHRITYAKPKSRGSKKHRRSRTGAPKGRRKGLRDITNAKHRRAKTTVP